jgi:hypothetical protein
LLVVLFEKLVLYAEAVALRGNGRIQLAAAELLHEQFPLPLT